MCILEMPLQYHFLDSKKHINQSCHNQKQLYTTFFPTNTSISYFSRITLLLSPCRTLGSNFINSIKQHRIPPTESINATRTFLCDCCQKARKKILEENQQNGKRRRGQEKIVRFSFDRTQNRRKREEDCPCPCLSHSVSS